MSPEPRKRPRRIPYTPEEVANIIAYKRRREQIKTAAFKRSNSYKLQNLLCVASFFIYWEIVFCFFGPARYQRHYSYKVDVKYGNVYSAQGRPIVTELEMFGVDGRVYNFIIQDFIDLPARYSGFVIGSDYLLAKPLKGHPDYATGDFRLFSASPVMLLIFVTLIILVVGFYNNLNQNPHSLMAMTVLNLLTLTGIICL